MFPKGASMKSWTVVLLALAMAISGLSIGCKPSDDGTKTQPKTSTTKPGPTTAPGK
jgi:hypothetical protein